MRFGGMAMELDTKVKTRISTLNEEMDSIHSANSLCWGKQEHTRMAMAEYQFRIERLDEIRTELTQLRAWAKVA
jgi:hypothetical protein